MDAFSHDLIRAAVGEIMARPEIMSRGGEVGPLQPGSTAAEREEGLSEHRVVICLLPRTDG